VAARDITCPVTFWQTDFNPYLLHRHAPM